MNQDNVDKAFEKMNELHTEMTEEGVTDEEFIAGMKQLMTVLEFFDEDE